MNAPDFQGKSMFHVMVHASKLPSVLSSNASPYLIGLKHSCFFARQGPKFRGPSKLTKNGHQIAHIGDNGLLTMCEQRTFGTNSYRMLECARYSPDERTWKKLRISRKHGRQISLPSNL